MAVCPTVSERSMSVSQFAGERAFGVERLAKSIGGGGGRRRRKRKEEEKAEGEKSLKEEEICLSGRLG